MEHGTTVCKEQPAEEVEAERQNGEPDAASLVREQALAEFCNLALDKSAGQIQVMSAEIRQTLLGEPSPITTEEQASGDSEPTTGVPVLDQLIDDACDDSLAMAFCCTQIPWYDNALGDRLTEVLRYKLKHCDSRRGYDATGSDAGEAGIVGRWLGFAEGLIRGATADDRQVEGTADTDADDDDISPEAVTAAKRVLAIGEITTLLRNPNLSPDYVAIMTKELDDPDNSLGHLKAMARDVQRRIDGHGSALQKVIDFYNALDGRTKFIVLAAHELCYLNGGELEMFSDYMQVELQAKVRESLGSIRKEAIGKQDAELVYLCGIYDLARQVARG